MKKYFSLCFILFFALQFYAQDTISVSVNDTILAKCLPKNSSEGCLILLNKSKCKKVKSFIINVSGTNTAGTLFTRDLELNSDSSFVISEEKTSPGKFDITKTNSKKYLQSGKTITLYLLLNPSNPNVMIASKRIYLGEIKMKK